MAWMKMVSCIWRRAGSWIQTSRSKILRTMLRFSYRATHGSSSHELLEACESTLLDESDLNSYVCCSSSDAKSSQGRMCRWCMPWRTTHMPFHAAISVEVPMKKPIMEMARHARPALLSVRMMATSRPAIMPKMPSPRAKMTRARLPLQMVQRTKLGCAWQRSDHSTVVMTSAKAEGCVVCWRACSSAVRSLEDRFSCREPLSAM